MATFQKRTKKNGEISYTVTIRVKGSKPQTATFNKMSLAKHWAQTYEPKMKEGKHLIDFEAKKHTLNNLIDRYISIELPKKNKDDIKKYIMQLNWWKNQIGEMLLSNITPAVLSECKEKLITEKSPKPQNGRTTRTGATANRYMAILSGVFSMATKEWCWMDDNPMLKVKKFTETAQKDRWLTSDEISKLLESCKKFNLKGENYNYETYLFVLIALSTGARYSEIRNLKWRDVDIDNKQFYFLITKNGENRGVPMSQKVYEELKEYSSKIKADKDKYVWLTKDGTKLIDMRIRFKKAIDLCNIKCRFHDLRHTVASHIAMRGGSLLEIAQVTGHKSMQMVKRYSHLTKKCTAELLQATTDEMFGTVRKNKGENNYDIK